jgi:hypothetical protein
LHHVTLLSRGRNLLSRIERSGHLLGILQHLLGQQTEATMPPNRRLQQAEKAADKLNKLVTSDHIAQLLQEPPPAAMTAGQAGLLGSCCTAMEQLIAVLPGRDRHPTSAAEVASAEQILQALLAQQAVQSVGALLDWTLQDPEQLMQQVGEPAATGAVRTLATTWVNCTECMVGMFSTVMEHGESSRMAGLATAVTMQLEASGE